jgi:hypothetical protein
MKRTRKHDERGDVSERSAVEKNEKMKISTRKISNSSA